MAVTCVVYDDMLAYGKQACKHIYPCTMFLTLQDILQS